MAATQQLSRVYPLGSRLTERGRLEIGGCDTIELAREFGTPAYVVAEEDLRARARAFRGALEARHSDSAVIFASKAFPAHPILRILAEEGLGCDVASAGELHLALRAGFDPARLVVHGNAKSVAELELALTKGVGHLVVDNFDEIDRLESIVATGGDAVRRGTTALLRVTPGVSGSTHAAITTGQADSKFGFSLADAPRAIERLRAGGALELAGLHFHLGSQLYDLELFRAAVAAIAPLGDFPVMDLGGGLGVAYCADDDPPSIEDYIAAKVAAVHDLLGTDRRILVEPGRALVANCCVTLYSVESVKRNVSTWVAVDGGMSDNLRPMLYGARYEVQVADRFGGGTRCHVAGKHCESGDVLARDVELADPTVGDVLVMPATGAYAHALANNYNGVPRPPLIICSEGRARVGVRRETVEDLEARDPV
ncbi:MAG: diaminopimelate decarboxylase [Solirubrobacteraceae bacterium]|nr:diaminopimelate decarboxylase [Solirubrobacteraceae bacterium]